MIPQYAQGHNQKSNLADFPYEPRIEAPVEYDTEYSADGLGNAVAGGIARMNYSFLEIEEAQILLPFFGINSRVPSAKCTVMIPDLFGIPLFYNGQVNLVMPRGGESFWVDFGLEFTALEQI